MPAVERREMRTVRECDAIHEKVRERLQASFWSKAKIGLTVALFIGGLLVGGVSWAFRHSGEEGVQNERIVKVESAAETLHEAVDEVKADVRTLRQGQQAQTRILMEIRAEVSK